MERSDMEPWCKICGKPTATAVRLLPEAQAVIEAAKALTHEHRMGDPSSVAAAEWAQAKAVDELLAAEGEE